MSKKKKKKKKNKKKKSIMMFGFVDLILLEFLPSKLAHLLSFLSSFSLSLPSGPTDLNWVTPTQVGVARTVRLAGRTLSVLDRFVLN